jgi:hypothetical protein
MRENKFKVQTTESKVMASVFWDSEGILLVEFVKRGTTVNSERRADIKEVKTTNSQGSAKQESSLQSRFSTL